MRLTRRFVPGVLVVAAVLVATACQDSDPPVADTNTPTTAVGTVSAPIPPSYDVRVTAGDCAFSLPAGQDEANVRCGYAEVPELRVAPGARTLRLAYAVLEKTNEAAEPPLLVLDGGPGGSTLGTLLGWFTARFAEPLQSQRDLVFIDYRGTGLSTPDMTCPEVDALSNASVPVDETDPDVQAAYEAALLACGERIVTGGADLSAYNTAALAADASDLMRALGYDAFDVYGVSYGTRVALTMLRDRSEGVRSVVLDSTFPPQVELYATTVANLQAAFERVFAACVADEGCSAAYPDLEERMYALVRQTGGTPLQVPYTDLDGNTATIEFDGRRLLSAFVRTLYNSRFVATLPAMIAAIERGDDTLLRPVAGEQYGGPTAAGAIAMRTSVLCAEELPFTTPESLREATVGLRPEFLSGRFGITNEAMLQEELDLCERWGAAALGGIEDRAVTSAVPVLILAGQFDPTTPLDWGRLAAETLANSYFYEVPGLGHSVLFQQQTTCPMEIIASFLAEPSVAPDAGCVEELAAGFELP
jgi:pimeloyl-ACP methyl ester carboxylesterase